MENRTPQQYEEYWSYTAAYTDLSGYKFLSVLKDCIKFLDEHKDCVYTRNNYKKLQSQVSATTGIAKPSVRKAINQLVKLGFLKPYLKGYVSEAKEYVNATTDRKRKSLLSKVVYSYSNFNNSMTAPNVFGNGEINFFLKTLEEVGVIDELALAALMITDIKKYPKGYLNAEELQKSIFDVKKSGFIERKYNQISHLRGLLKRLDDLKIYKNAIYFKTDAIRLFGNDEETRKAVRDTRDTYLQRIYKSELEEESINHFKCNNPKCMIEGLSHPVLIASHIKPYKSSASDEAFDVNNGLLLSRNMDSLFDLGYITFNDSGQIIPSRALDDELAAYISKFSLHKDFINAKRMEYMKFHRKNIFEKRYSSNNIRRFYPPAEISQTTSTEDS